MYFRSGGIISYLVVEQENVPDDVRRAATHRQPAELHVTDSVQMLLTLGMFARQRLGSVRGSEVSLTLASLTNSFPTCASVCANLETRATQLTAQLLKRPQAYRLWMSLPPELRSD